MSTKMSLAEMMADLERRVAFHSEQERIHAEQEAAHRETRSSHAAGNRFHPIPEGSSFEESLPPE
jgi:acid phosphatase class B